MDELKDIKTRQNFLETRIEAYRDEMKNLFDNLNSNDNSISSILTQTKAKID